MRTIRSVKMLLKAEYGDGCARKLGVTYEKRKNAFGSGAGAMATHEKLNVIYKKRENAYGY